MYVYRGKRRGRKKAEKGCEAGSVDYVMLIIHVLSTQKKERQLVDKTARVFDKDRSPRENLGF